MSRLCPDTMSEAQPSGADTLSLRLPAELPKLLWLLDWPELRPPPVNWYQPSETVHNAGTPMKGVGVMSIA